MGKWVWPTLGFSTVAAWAVLVLPTYLAVAESVQAAAGLLPLSLAAVVAVLRAQPAAPPSLRRALRDAHPLIALHIGLLPALLLSVAAPAGTPLIGLLVTVRSVGDLLMAALMGWAVGRSLPAPPLAGLGATCGVALVWIAGAGLTRTVTGPLMLASTGGTAASPHLTGLLLAVGVSGGLWLWLGAHP